VYVLLFKANETKEVKMEGKNEKKTD